MTGYKERRREIENEMKRKGVIHLDVKDLADEYNISERTIYNDFDAIKENLQEVDGEEIYFSSKMILEMCKRELRKLIENEHPNVRLGAVRTLLKTIDKEYEWAERLGVIGESAEKTEEERQDEGNKALAETWSDIQEAIKKDAEDEDEDAE